MQHNTTQNHTTQNHTTQNHTTTGQHRPAARADRGQAIGLILVAIVLISSMGIAISLVGVRLHNRSAARSAADAAALAGALDGARAAGAVAARNGGDLVSYSEVRSGPDVVVTVVVRVDGETATARASTEP